MVNESDLIFARGQEDVEERTRRHLRGVRGCIEEMRAVFLYRVNLHEIGITTLQRFEQELRGIHEQLDTDTTLKAALHNVDAIIAAIQDAKTSIYLAIDLQNMRQTYENRKRLYSEYRNIAHALTRALEHLLAIPPR
ncbi:hypothetical protein [Thermogemmatispora tikiterensis]|uniref:Uncharacterized protein n=1 Tax=Thermogemmatispora tikiterensis TaxID=1825093 RepID=A0A328VJA5_9CHLR|nr:hypothetical protein [Thermogemmatispora tikiterensis]RAQ97557.1 hypothetical protein A4R35_18615 [Thermogemmatispora tikiterensis]